ncbi:MAG: hypothetical protein KF720_08960 [Rubrivivax sp.]|nr:hypothetical protein [Rubrivivax sp.]
MFFLLQATPQRPASVLQTQALAPPLEGWAGQKTGLPRWGIRRYIMHNYEFKSVLNLT